MVMLAGWVRLADGWSDLQFDGLGLSFSNVSRLSTGPGDRASVICRFAVQVSMLLISLADSYVARLSFTVQSNLIAECDSQEVVIFVKRRPLQVVELF